MRRISTLIAFALIALPMLALAQGPAQPANESSRKVMSRVPPVYPELAKRMHLQGVVKVEALVRANGTVKSTRVLGGNPVLVEAATSAVNKWRFEPRAEETTEVVQLTFVAEE